MADLHGTFHILMRKFAYFIIRFLLNSLPFAWITGPATDPSYQNLIRLEKYFEIRKKVITEEFDQINLVLQGFLKIF